MKPSQWDWEKCTCTQNEDKESLCPECERFIAHVENCDTADCECRDTEPYGC